MAKQFSFADLAAEISKVDDLGSIATSNSFSEITEWIGLGNYLLNAQVSGSLFGGAPNKRSVMLAGPSGCLPKNSKIRIYKIKDSNNERKIKRYPNRMEKNS